MELTLEKLLAIVRALPDPLFILTESGRYAGVFGGGDRNYYHDGSGLVGKSLYDVLPKHKADWFMERIHSALEDERLITGEYGLAGSDVRGIEADAGPGGEIRFEGRVQPLPFLIDGERAVVWTARNISDRHALETQLRRTSETDDLTGAYNRRKLLGELGRLYRQFRRYGTPTALLLFDIDHFKRVNDQHGHAAGDEVLRATVALCRGQLRDVDVFARSGGEEFVVLLPHTTLDSARCTAERLRRLVADNAVACAETAVRITISIGVCVLSEADTGVSTILKRADAALYEAKARGRNCVAVAAGQ